MKRLYLIAALAALPSVADAATINAASCSSSAVQTALNSSQAGDTVVIPSGTCNWSTTVTWTAPANVTVQGAGTTATGGGDQTNIVDALGTDTPILVIGVTPGSNPSIPDFRFTGITVKGGAVSGLKQSGVVQINAGAKTYVRIDHTHWNSTTYSSPHTSNKMIQFGGQVYGVIDHNIMDFWQTSAFFIYNNGSTSYGDSVFAEDTGFGGKDFLFMEDNIVNGTIYTCNGSEQCSSTRIFDAMMGGKVVARFNNLNGSCTGEAHDTGSAGDTRGQRAIEIYGNYTAPLSGQTVGNYDLVRMTNGVGLIWGNSAASNSYTNVILFKVIRKDNEHGAQPAPPNGWGQCGTEYNGTGSAWDQNTSALTGYACLDQPGRGKSNLLTGSFAGQNRRDTTTGTVHWPDQLLEPIYLWKNAITIQPGWGGNWYSNSSSGRINANRDYYDQASGVQISATSPFNGTSGTGWGTLARRPTTCTTGVGYFATDQGSWNISTSNPYGVQQNGADGQLYTCTSTNTWSLYYTPYTYPHPLTNPSGSPPIVSAISCSNLNPQSPGTTICTATASNSPTSYAWTNSNCIAQCTTAATTNPATYTCNFGGACDICVTATNANGSGNYCTSSSYIKVKYRKPSSLTPG